MVGDAEVFVAAFAHPAGRPKEENRANPLREHGFRNGHEPTLITSPYRNQFGVPGAPPSAEVARGQSVGWLRLAMVLRDAQPVEIMNPTTVFFAV